LVMEKREGGGAPSWIENRDLSMGWGMGRIHARKGAVVRKLQTAQVGSFTSKRTVVEKERSKTRQSGEVCLIVRVFVE